MNDMKQSITRQQFAELTSEQYRKLANILIGTDNHSIFDLDKWQDAQMRWKQQMTIGEMIEFLGEHDRGTLYEVMGGLFDREGFVFNYKELCDSLWEAVKECLKLPTL